MEKRPPSSWPTLEILPGGVIKKPDKFKESEGTYPSACDDDRIQETEMMYACAKCSQRFKYLFCLVKHVKWHEDEAKRHDMAKPKQETSNYVCTHTNKRKMMMCIKSHKKKSPKKRKV